VLDQDPKNTVAIASIASLYLNQKKWDDAQQWYEKLIAVDPRTRMPTTAWGSSPGRSGIPPYGTARANLGMKQEDPGPIKDKKVREELKAEVRPGDRRRSEGARQGAPDQPRLRRRHGL
jgi:tetratricopeptide (TPR) repeat protein